MNRSSDIRKRKKRFLSMTLALVMVLGCAWGVGESRAAVGTPTECVIPDNLTFEIDSDTFVISDVSYELSALQTIKIGNASQLILNEGISNPNLVISGGSNSTLTVSSTSSIECKTVECGRISNMGTIASNNIICSSVLSTTESSAIKGNLELKENCRFDSLGSVYLVGNPTCADSAEVVFSSGQVEVSGGIDFSKWGRVTMKSCGFNASSYALNSNNVSFDDGASVSYVINSAASESKVSLKGFENTQLLGNIYANSNTILESNGGKFGLTVAGTYLGEYSGEVASIEARMMNWSSAAFEVTSMSGIYQGMDYSFEVKVTSGPSEYVYSDSQYTVTYDDDSNELPKNAGEHTMIINAKPIEEYTCKGGVYKYEYEIGYLPLDSSMEVEGGGYLTIGTLPENKYVNTETGVTLKPASGYLVSIDGGKTFDQSVTLKKFDPGMSFILKNNTSSSVYYGAETEPAGYDKMCPGLANLIFDTANPVITKSYVDGELKSIDLGGTVKAKKIEITIADENLEKVVSSDGKEIATVKKSGDTYVAEVSFEATVGKTTDVEFWAYDKSGRSTKVSFKLEYVLIKPDVKLTVADVRYGQDITPVLTTNSDGKSSVKYYYKKQSEDDKAYTKDVPTAVGKYVCKAVIPATNTYESAECTAKFSIVRKSVGETKVEIEDTYVGKDYEPVLTTDSDGKKKAVFTYKSKDEDDSAYTTKKPTKAGTYIVKATIPATDKYEEETCTSEFKIRYLSNELVKYAITGTKGKNGYYTSDVYLVAQKGYVISSEEDGEYKQRILYNKNIDKVYIKRLSDGARTNALSVDTIKVDKDVPEFACNISGDVISISDGKEVYADTLSITISDEHLSKVTLDGKEVKVNNNLATIMLDSENGEKTFTITTEDEAGNENNIRLVLMSSWMESGSIPSGKKVPLVSGKGYNFEVGKWTVSGDTTIYNGGITFYVVSPGEYTFTKE